MCYPDDGVFFQSETCSCLEWKNIFCVLTEVLVSFIDFHFAVCGDEYCNCDLSSAYLTLNQVVGLYMES
jgi:hypothetical protein